MNTYILKITYWGHTSSAWTEDIVVRSTASSNYINQLVKEYKGCFSDVKKRMKSEGFKFKYEEHPQIVHISR